MKKIDKTVKKETLYIAAVTLILSALMQSVFLIISKWNTTVLLGNLLGAITAVGNFFLMGLTVQTALERDEKGAKKLVRLSQGLRYIMLIAVAAIGHFLSAFNLVAVIVPFIFPSIAVRLRPLFKNF